MNMAAAKKQGWLKSIVLLIIFVVEAKSLELDIYRHTTIPSDTENSPGQKPIDDSVVLYKYMNAEYYGIIGVGHPSVEFKVTFDTTWADSWLPSQHCGFTQVACLIHTRYDGSKSSTHRDDGRIFKRGDSELSLSGYLSVDNFHLAHVEIMNQTFAEITEMSYLPFIANKADGVIGLAYDSLAQRNTTPFFYNLRKQGIVDKPIFTFYMNRDPTTPKAGKLLLGMTERSHIRGNLTFLKVVEKKYWTIQMDRVVVDANNKSYVFCKNGCNATIDTSGNQIMGPPPEIQSINNLLHANAISPGWPYRSVVNCRTFAKLPHVTFVLGGEYFTIESKYYVQHYTLYGFNACVSPFTPSDDNTWSLGGAFLMQFYTEFDFSKGRVGIAETLF